MKDLNSKEQDKQQNTSEAEHCATEQQRPPRTHHEARGRVHGCQRGRGVAAPRDRRTRVHSARHCHRRRPPSGLRARSTTAATQPQGQEPPASGHTCSAGTLHVTVVLEMNVADTDGLKQPPTPPQQQSNAHEPLGAVKRRRPELVELPVRRAGSAKPLRACSSPKSRPVTEIRRAESPGAGAEMA